MLKRILIFIFLLALFGAVTFFVIQIHRNQILPIKTVSIKGDIPPADESHISGLISDVVRHSLLSVDLKEIQSQVQTFPWVQQAEVRRVWPDQISIMIFNQEPVAWWNDRWLLNAYGEFFLPGSFIVPDNLPKFYGKNDFTIKMLAYYQQINTMIVPLKLTINQFQMDSAGTCQAVLNNGTTLILGNEDVLNRVQRFVDVYSKIFQANKQAKTVDLRYSHGVAVKW